MKSIEFLLILAAIGIFLIFWWRAYKQKKKLATPPLWFNHLAQRLGLLADLKRRLNNVLTGERNGFYYNIGGFPMENPSELYVSIGFRKRFDCAWKLIALKAPAPENRIRVALENPDMDEHFALYTTNDQALAAKTLFQQPAVQSLLDFLKTYPYSDWELGIHEDAIYYKEPYDSPISGTDRVNHLHHLVDVLYDLGGKARGWK